MIPPTKLPSHIWELVRASITVQKRRCFNNLFPIFAALTFKRLVCFTVCVLVVFEQGAQVAEREVAFNVFRL